MALRLCSVLAIFWQLWQATPLGELLTSLVEWLQHNNIIDTRVKVDGVKLLFWSIAVAAIVLLQPRGVWPYVCRILRRCCSRYGQYERRCCITSAGREEFGCCEQVRKSLVVQSNERISVYSAPLNAGLAAEPLQRDVE